MTDSSTSPVATSAQSATDRLTQLLAELQAEHAAATQSTQDQQTPVAYSMQDFSSVLAATAPTAEAASAQSPSNLVTTSEHFQAVMTQLNRKYAVGQASLGDLLQAVKSTGVQPLSATPQVTTPVPPTISQVTPPSVEPILEALEASAASVVPVAPTPPVVAPPTFAPSIAPVQPMSVPTSLPETGLKAYVTRLSNHLKQHGRLVLTDYRAGSKV